MGEKVGLKSRYRGSYGRFLIEEGGRYEDYGGLEVEVWYVLEVFNVYLFFYDIWY